ncbi:MAG TPA: regulatory protein RecX [Coxiellaceae bacterium]|nr:regulatory protein RecX [Gammaproteobacteria bacterium]HLD84611.1 regulatory protein RecX [Coxiellaceae bacterium]
MREKAIQLLARREHSRLELKQKLLARNYSEQEINTLLETLETKNLQSDARFAACYVRSRLAAGFGPLRIEAELQERGVSSSLIADNIYQADIHWEVELKTLWQKKFNKTQNDIEKQYRFLQSRGYTLEQIKSAQRERVKTI